MKPSTLPVASIWPSGENCATSEWLLAPNLMVLSSSDGYRSTCGGALYILLLQNIVINKFRKYPNKYTNLEGTLVRGSSQ